MKKEFLWTEVYRPSTVDETILPKDLKSIFKKFVKQKNIPNLILTGTAGLGKTTVAKAMLEELGCDYMLINGSMDRNIDTLRNEIMEFASTTSFMGGRKYVILDESDYLNSNSTQPALRNFMEEFSSNCGFILTCNYLNKIIPELQSRCSIISFQIPKKEASDLAMQFFNRTIEILNKENVPFEKAVLAEIIQKFYPDWRHILNQLQTYSASGAIDTGILASLQDGSIKELVKLLKDKKFIECRKWVVDNLNNDSTTIFRKIYDASYTHMVPESVPQLVLIIGKYQYQSSFVADHEINLMACLTEIMMECKFK